MVWADASSSPLLSGPATSHRRPPPPIGGSPFFLLSSSSILIVQQRTPGAWVKRQSSEPLVKGLLTRVRPLTPNPNPSPLAFLFAPLFPVPGAKLTAPSPSRLRLQKCTIGRRQGGGWGRGPGWGALGRGLMQLWGLPSFPPPQCTGLELAPPLPRLRCRGAG